MNLFTASTAVFWLLLGLVYVVFFDDINCGSDILKYRWPLLHACCCYLCITAWKHILMHLVPKEPEIFLISDFPFRTLGLICMKARRAPGLLRRTYKFQSAKVFAFWHPEKHTCIRYLHQVPFAHHFSLFSLQDFLNQLLFAWCSKQDWLPRFQIIQVKHHVLHTQNISSNLLRSASAILTLTVHMDSQHSRYCSPACSQSSWGCSTHSRCPGSCHCWWGSWSQSEGRRRRSPGRPDSPTARAPSSAPAGLAAGRPAADLSPARTENS